MWKEATCVDGAVQLNYIGCWDGVSYPPTHPPTHAKASVMNDQRIWLAVFYQLDCIASVLLCSSLATMDLWMSARLARSSRGLLACGVCLCIPVHDHYCVFLSVMILGGLDSS